MRIYRLYLIRHGITEGNIEGKYIGASDLDLCEEGAARILELMEQYEYPNVGKVYTSPLKRCIQTARLIYPQMTPVVVDDIKEYNFGEFENKTVQELKEDETYRNWLESPREVIPQGAEPMEQFRQRVMEGFERIVLDMMHQKISDAAVITHSGVIMSILSRCGLPKRDFMDWAIDSGHGYTLLINTSLWANDRLAEVFTPIPYGTGINQVMLDYQKELSYGE